MEETKRTLRIKLLTMKVALLLFSIKKTNMFEKSNALCAEISGL